jgi:hypothetical protein
MKKISYYLHERWSQTSTRQDGPVTSSEYELKKEPLLIQYLLEIRWDIFSLWAPYLQHELSRQRTQTIKSSSIDDPKSEKTLQGNHEIIRGNAG